MSTTLTEGYLKNAQATSISSKAAWSACFFPSDYDIKSQKEDESEKKYLVDKTAND